MLLLRQRGFLHWLQALRSLLTHRMLPGCFLTNPTNLRVNLWLLLAAPRSGFFQVPSLAHQRETVEGSACGFHLLSFDKAGSRLHGGSPERWLHQLQRRKHSDVIWSPGEEDCKGSYFIGHAHAQHRLKSDANAFFIATLIVSPWFVPACCRSESV